MRSSGSCYQVQVPPWEPESGPVTLKWIRWTISLNVISTAMRDTVTLPVGRARWIPMSLACQCTPQEAGFCPVLCRVLKELAESRVLGQPGRDPLPRPAQLQASWRRRRMEASPPEGREWSMLPIPWPSCALPSRPGSVSLHTES